MRVGLTGGIGSGKSVVATIFEKLGALIVDTDVLSREAVAPGTPGLQAIAKQWPEAIKNGELDRVALAKIVFADESAREHLNAIVHPEVRRLARELEATAKPGQLVIHVVPLLFETGYSALVDKTVVVLAPREQRLARTMARDDCDENAVIARMTAQIDPGEAAKRADYTIVNDGDLEQLLERTAEVYNELALMTRRG